MKITVLILLGDRSLLSSIFFSCFWVLFHDTTALMVIMKLSCVELKVS